MENKEFIESVYEKYRLQRAVPDALAVIQDLYHQVLNAESEIAKLRDIINALEAGKVKDSVQLPDAPNTYTKIPTNASRR